MSNRNIVVFLNSFSESTYFQNNLPGGKVNNSQSLQCYLYVADSLTAITISSRNVVVSSTTTNNLFGILISQNSFVQENKNDNSTVIPYISNELLKAAQTNIYDENSYNTEIKQDKNSYGIQGLNSDNAHFEAFDNSCSNTYTHL